MPRRRGDPGFGYGPPQYPGTFLLAFREALADLNWQVRRYLGNRVECADEQGGEQVVGLENLYRRARRLPREDWPNLIAEFLRQVNITGQIDELPNDLALVADQLLIRLGKPLQSLSDDARVWAMPLEGTDLVINLVIDYPNRMIYVTEKLVEDAGRAGDEWLQRALANLREQTEENCFQVVHDDSGLRICNVGDAYDSSRVLLVEEFLPEGRANGYFVALPSRDQLLVLPVGPPALAFLHLMKLIVEKEHQSAPYPISDEIYWMRGGAWHRFVINIQGDKITLQPPPEFHEVFQRFLEEEGDAETPDSEGA